MICNLIKNSSAVTADELLFSTGFYVPYLLAHCGETSFTFDELLEESDMDLKSLLRDSVVTMLQEREDIQMAESQSIDIDFQSKPSLLRN